ncbi:hypothetical protein OAV22_00390 [Flavobacteriaceae bacterium]|jgi:hypothetical protein|nr:hypothetical protein [Flavobacteriaceae bacterium]
MSNTTLAFVLSIIFTSITVLPDIMVMVDNTYDVSVLIDSSEEEEKKGEEKGKDLEIEILENIKQDFTTYKINLVDILRLRNDNYRSYSKELTSPPPEPCI